MSDTFTLNAEKPKKRRGRPAKAMVEAEAEIIAEVPKVQPELPHPEDPADVDSVGLTIEYADGFRKQAAEDAFLAGYDSRVKAFAIKNEACGCSASYKSFEVFPLHDIACPCGRYNHALIKFARK